MFSPLPPSPPLPSSPPPRPTRLKKLKVDLKSCDQLTNDACEVVAKIKTLQRLFLGGLANITDEGVQKLLPLEELTHVSMYVGDSVTRRLGDSRVMVSLAWEN